MFGYVNISEKIISQQDKELYRSYYCGLCKAIGKKTQLFRLTLNNDLTFLGVLLSAIEQNEPEFAENKKCIVHPRKKHKEVSFNSVMDYVSDMNILLVYLKVCDDAHDDKKLFSVILKFLFSFRALQVQKKYSDLSKKIKTYLRKLSKLENEKCPDIDEVADCFAKILEDIFIPDFIDDERNKRILSWIGYNLGRWIYIVDAYADIEKDRRKKSYNPFLYSDDKEIKAVTYDALTLSLSNIANAFDLLEIYRNKSLLENTFFSGLPGVQEGMFSKTEGKDGSL